MKLNEDYGFHLTDGIGEYHRSAISQGTWKAPMTEEFLRFCLDIHGLDYNSALYLAKQSKFMA